MQFGKLMKLWGVVYYSLSPNELRPFAGMWNPGAMNTLRRIRENIFYIGLPLATSVSVYLWATEEFRQNSHKHPEDYKDDV